jgi:hypothetical protein
VQKKGSQKPRTFRWKRNTSSQRKPLNKNK